MKRALKSSKNNIPDIAEKIQKVLHAHRLKPSTPPGQFIKEHHNQKHRYATIARDEQGTKVLFYARLHKNLDAYHKFRREIVFIRTVKQSSSILKKFVPDVLASSLKPEGEWFIRTFIPTPALGSIHFVNRNVSEKETTRFVKLFQALQHIPYSQKLRPLEIRGGDFLLNSAEGCLKTARDFFSSKEVASIRHVLHESYSLINKSAKHLVHGDCHPGNILYDVHNFSIIDWEIVHFNSRVDDIAYFYAGLAAHEKLRRSLIPTFASSISWGQEFRKLFPIYAMSFALNHLCTLKANKPNELTERQRKEVMQYAQHIVKRSLEGYTTLIKL